MYINVIGIKLYTECWWCRMRSLTGVSVLMLRDCCRHDSGCRSGHGDSQGRYAGRCYGHWTDVGDDPWPCHLWLGGRGLGSNSRWRGWHRSDVGSFRRLCDRGTNRKEKFIAYDRISNKQANILIKSVKGLIYNTTFNVFSKMCTLTFCFLFLSYSEVVFALTKFLDKWLDKLKSISCSTDWQDVNRDAFMFMMMVILLWSVNWPGSLGVDIGCLAGCLGLRGHRLGLGISLFLHGDYLWRVNYNLHQMKSWKYTSYETYFSTHALLS